MSSRIRARVRIESPMLVIIARLEKLKAGIKAGILISGTTLGMHSNLIGNPATRASPESMIGS
jgi:hypothetical protein